MSRTESTPPTVSHSTCATPAQRSTVLVDTRRERVTVMMVPVVTEDCQCEAFVTPPTPHPRTLLSPRCHCSCVCWFKHATWTPTVNLNYISPKRNCALWQSPYPSIIYLVLVCVMCVYIMIMELHCSAVWGSVLGVTAIQGHHQPLVSVWNSWLCFRWYLLFRPNREFCLNLRFLSLFTEKNLVRQSRDTYS